MTNLPATICHSNAAAAFLQLAGNPTEMEPGPETEADRKFCCRKNHQSWAELAEYHAKCATVVCGDYEKGHVRLKCCYERLGKKKEAKKEAQSITQFQKLQQNQGALPTMCHLFLVSWIDQFSLHLFMMRRLHWVLHRMTDENERDPILHVENNTSKRFPGRRFQAMFSMVPISGGQWFTATICLAFGIQIYTAYFQAFFPTHNLDLEKPPNGIIHPEVTLLLSFLPFLLSHILCGNISLVQPLL